MSLSAGLNYVGNEESIAISANKEHYKIYNLSLGIYERRY